MVRSPYTSSAVTDAMRRAVRGVDADVPVSPSKLMTDVVAGTLAARRFQMRLYAALGIAALVLASLGLYSVLSYVTARRTREMAIRMAVGGSRAAVVGLVVSDGMRLAGIGVAFGLVLAALSTRWIQSSLYGVGGLDPTAYVAVAAMLAGVSLLACAAPARRAARVDPAVALRAP